MSPFAFARPATTPEALALARDGSAFVAGGTELLNWLRRGIVAPDLVIDIGSLPGLDFIEPHGNGWRIGALARLSDVGAHRQLRESYPVLTQAILKAASPQLRNLATLGGSLMQATRCPYFRAEENLPCNKRNPASGCSARHGLNETHAILDWTDACVATQPSDPATALAALDATIIATTSEGERSIAVRDFFTSAAEDPTRHTVLRPGELVTAICLPTPAPASAYLKVQHRAAFAFAAVSVAVCLDLDAGIIGSARIALGSVAHRPWRLARSEEALKGCGVSSPELDDAIAVGFADARPLAHNAFKIPLAKAAVIRAIAAAAS